MAIIRHTERRQGRQARLRLEHSFLFRIPPRLAWGLIVAALCAVAIIEFLAPRQIWFGPAYLAVIALAAWSLGSRIAVAVGLSILAIKFGAAGFSFYPYGPQLALPNLAVRIAAIMVVVGFIGMARKSCEREWRLARTDPLTGALNRQAFFEIVRSGQCSGGWSALIFADLDGLKRLNDGEGHDRGDQGLKGFADTIMRTIRKGDIFARMGGDEFVIFMKLKNEDAGQAVARRLHQAINTDAPEVATRLKCSLGLLILPDGSKSIDAELRAADELMYEAKKSRAGILVATAIRHEGKIDLSPTISVTGIAGHGSSIRKTDRDDARDDKSAGRDISRSGPRAAA